MDFLPVFGGNTLIVLIAFLLALSVVAGLRIPLLSALARLASVAAVVLIVIVATGQEERFGPQLARVLGAIEPDRQRVVGEEMRLRMAPDGHFWATVSLDGVERRMLVDSGATITAISQRTASKAGVDTGKPGLPILIRTANGTVPARSGEVEELRLGNIKARDLGVVVSPAFGEVDVLGMNFLSRLKSWRVEGKTLILTPHHPQPVADAAA